jgi:RecG-like helicase
MFEQKLDILVTTPIVEVGIDLPQAAAMIIGLDAASWSMDPTSVNL